MSKLTIGEVARRAGVRASAIRYYEGEGLLPEPARAGGQRRYGPEVLNRLAIIGGAQRAGFTIAEIRTLLHGFPAGTPASVRWRVLADPKIAEVDERIARALEMRGLLERARECACTDMEDCLTLASSPRGIRGTPGDAQATAGKPGRR
jgi:MerR family redox-sensitive transcriptional activator SoxR